MVKIMENPIKMDDLGVPLFLEIPTWRKIHSLKLTANTSENRPGPKETKKYSNHPFSGAMLVSGRVGGETNFTKNFRYLKWRVS